MRPVKWKVPAIPAGSVSFSTMTVAGRLFTNCNWMLSSASRSTRNSSVPIGLNIVPPSGSDQDAAHSFQPAGTSSLTVYCPGSTPLMVLTLPAPVPSSLSVKLVWPGISVCMVKGSPVSPVSSLQTWMVPGRAVFSKQHSTVSPGSRSMSTSFGAMPCPDPRSGSTQVIPVTS